MKLRASILFISLVLILSGTTYSGDSYPKTVVIDGDTLVAITRAQRDTAFSRLNYCQELPVLKKLLFATETANDDFRKLSQLQNARIDSQAARIAAGDILTTAQASIIQSQETIIKTQNKKNRRTKLATVLVTVPAAFVAGFLSAFLTGR